MVRSGYRTATVAVIEDTNNEAMEMVRPPSASALSVKQTSLDNEENDDQEMDVTRHMTDDDDDYMEGVTGRQKTALGFIW